MKSKILLHLCLPLHLNYRTILMKNFVLEMKLISVMNLQNLYVKQQ